MAKCELKGTTLIHKDQKNLIIVIKISKRTLNSVVLTNFLNETFIISLKGKTGFF